MGEISKLSLFKSTILLYLCNIGIQQQVSLLYLSSPRLCFLIIHRLNDEYITVVFVPGSLLRSTQEFKLGYFMGVPGSLLNFTVIRNSSRKSLLVV